jgi:hypothetical protein
MAEELLQDLQDFLFDTSTRRALLCALVAFILSIAVTMGAGFDQPAAPISGDPWVSTLPQETRAEGTDSPPIPSAGHSAQVPTKEERRALSSYQKLSLSFVPNAGQSDHKVLFSSTGPGYGFYFTKNKIVLSFARGRRGIALDLVPIGASTNPRLEPMRRQPGRVNYLTGSERHTNLPSYQALSYRDLWPGIDLVVHGQRGRLKYEFVLKPGAKPSNIRLAYRGASGLSIGQAGNLLIDTPLGVLRDARPHSYQLIRGKRIPIESRYTLPRGDSYGYKLGAAYDPRRPLVIDPGLVYSTYLGGDGIEVGGSGFEPTASGAKIAIDGSGSAYVTDTVTSPLSRS